MASNDIGPRIGIQGEAAYYKSIAAINAQTRSLGAELQALTAKFAKNADSEEALTAKNEVLGRSVDTAKNKLSLLDGQLTGQREKLEALGRALDEATEKFGTDSSQALKAQNAYNAQAKEVANLEQQYHRTTAELASLEDALAGAGNALEDTAAKADGFGDVLAGNLVFEGITKGLRLMVQELGNAVSASVKFESAFAGVAKTVDGSDAQLAAIRNEIRSLSAEIPATTSEIAAVAEAAGQLGVATDSVMEFTRVMIDLGESTNLSAEEAASSLAKFANITRTSEQNYGRLGSVIVKLGNSFATTEADIVSMSTRLASAGTLAGLSEAEILALAAAMSSVGIEVEAGGTAMTQTLTAIEKAVSTGGKKLERLAEIAGMTGAQFASAWKRDAISAIQAFISGLGNLDERGESATAVLEELGMSGVRQSNMLKSLALAAGELSSSVDLASTAWVENTALAEEAAKRYETTESKMAMASNAAENLRAAVGDALTPALGSLAEAGTKLASWGADMIEEFPQIVSLMVGGAAAAGTLTVGLTGLMIVNKLTASIEGATGALSALNIVMGANPAIAVTAGIVGLVAVIGTLALTAEKAVDPVTELNQALEESRTGYENTSAALQSQRADLEGSVDALERLAETENRTSVEQAALLARVEELNREVPELNLAWDEQTGSLNMTADAIREVVAAEQHRREQAAAAARLNELYDEQAQITEQLAQANTKLEKAQTALAQAEQNAAAGFDNAVDQMNAYWDEVAAVQHEVDLLSQALEANAAQQEALNAAFEESRDGLEKHRAALEEETAAAELAAPTMEELAQRAEELEDISLSLSKGIDTVSKAMDEQKKSGSLSLSTILDLVDAGYAAALAVDSETGAVTLNREAYIQLAKDKLDAQIATLETEKASVDAALANAQETQAVIASAQGYLEKAKAVRAAKIAEKYAEGGVDIAALQNQTKAYEAQIAALEKLKKNLGSYTGTVMTQKAKTQAEKDLEAYKDLKAELDHQRAMDEVDEADYYRRLSKLRDTYLSDSANLSEHWKIDEQLHSYDKSLLRAQQQLLDEQAETEEKRAQEETKTLEKQKTEREKLEKERYSSLSKWADRAVKEQELSLKQQYEMWRDIQSRFEAGSEQYASAEEKIFDLRIRIREEFFDRAKEINENIESLEENYRNQLDSRAKEIFNTYKLFEEIPKQQILSGQELTANLEGQIARLEEFYSELDQLARRGAPEEMVEEIRAMGPSASSELWALVRMSDEELSRYADLYREKQELANRMALEELSDLREETDIQIRDNLRSLEKLYDENAPLVGQSFTAGLAEGIRSGMSDVINAAVSVAQSAVDAVRTELGIHSPSTVEADMEKNMSLWFGNGFVDSFRAVKRDIEEMMSFHAGSSPRDDFGDMLAQAVNAFGTLSGTDSPQSATIILQTPDGLELARWLVPDIRTAMRESPEVGFEA